MSRPRPKIGPTKLKRPTLDTKFHIDYEWWEQSNLDLKTYLLSRLEIREDTPLDIDLDVVDLVDADTGEVRRVDGFQYALQIYFSRLPEDFARHTSLVDGVFYILLANANKPMTARDLAERIERDPETVLRTLSGTRIYQGIRPIFDEE